MRHWECGVQAPAVLDHTSGRVERRGPPVTHPAPGLEPRRRSNGETDGRHRQALAQGQQSPPQRARQQSPRNRSARAPRAKTRRQAVRTLIAYIGDDPEREGLLDTPKRVVGAYEELYRGYRESPAEALERTFSETGDYDDLVLVRDISFNSACEHHMMPFTGRAHVAYMPVDKVVGLSKLARLVDVYARRLQTQEHMNSQIATAIEEILKPRGVAVMIEAEHTCMSLRGVEKPGALTVTTQFRGAFRDDPNEQLRFINLVRGEPAVTRILPLSRCASRRQRRKPSRPNGPGAGICAERAVALECADCSDSRRAIPRSELSASHDRSTANHATEEGLALRAEVRRRRARHLRRHRRLDRRRADGRAHERPGAAADRSRPARPGTTRARAGRCGRRAKAPATPSASPRCASTATRTRSGSRSSSTGRAPATPGGAPASTARCRSARRARCALEFRDGDKTFDPKAVYGNTMADAAAPRIEVKLASHERGTVANRDGRQPPQAQHAQQRADARFHRAGRGARRTRRSARAGAHRRGRNGLHRRRQHRRDGDARSRQRRALHHARSSAPAIACASCRCR